MAQVNNAIERGSHTYNMAAAPRADPRLRPTDATVGLRLVELLPVFLGFVDPGVSIVVLVSAVHVQWYRPTPHNSHRLLQRTLNMMGELDNADNTVRLSEYFCRCLLRRILQEPYCDKGLLSPKKLYLLLIDAGILSK
ncbi:MAG TPA: hypothetical protein VJ742_13150 [Nitrososphaera sp.]|nr:hypothetical protein [Nitrososphaera sp.]